MLNWNVCNRTVLELKLPNYAELFEIEMFFYI